MPRRIESFFIDGPTGRLEALLEEPEAAETDAAALNQVALICHPHPLYGGTMHNKVVYRLARGFRKAGAAVLRFNFRGVSRSEGVHDEGVGEIEDARAALGVLRQRYPDLPYSLAGFSFGSRVALKLGCEAGTGLPEPLRLVAAGFPTRRERFDYMAHCELPKYFLQSTNDEFGPRRELEAAFEWFAEPKSLRFIEARDHFFDGALDEFEQAVVDCASGS
jgi:alpha/beta superfamily hydrolase